MISITDLTVDFGPVRALDHVTLDLPSGAIMVLAGPNGSGKSTLLWAMAGLLLPTSGAVRLRGPAGVPSIGFLAHQSFLYEELTPLENLVLAARLCGLSDPAGRSIGMIRKIGLESESRRRVSTLSRGQQQLAAFARAGLPDPPGLCLGGPFSNLDRTAVHVIRQMLDPFVSPDRLAVIATHDPNPEPLSGLPTRCIQIESGRVRMVRGAS